MATAPDSGLAVRDDPQPLGFLPTRRFWEDAENRRLAFAPVTIAGGALCAAIFLIVDALAGSRVLSVICSFVGFMFSVVLVRGLFERYIRRAAQRRFRSRPELEPPHVDDT
jgi:hypothetical protein